jgi:hypothetical protein
LDPERGWRLEGELRMKKGKVQVKAKEKHWVRQKKKG